MIDVSPNVVELSVNDSAIFPASVSLSKEEKVIDASSTTFDTTVIPRQLPPVQYGIKIINVSSACSGYPRQRYHQHPEVLNSLNIEGRKDNRYS